MSDDLTLEELAELEEFYGNPRRPLQNRHNVRKLLVMARRLIEIENAMMFIAFSPKAAAEWDRVDTTDDILDLALEHGWKGLR